MTMSRIYQAVEKKPNHLEVGYGVSERADSFAAGEEAARQAIEGISGQPLSAVLVFASVRYDLAALLAGIGGVVGDAPVMGATTAGEICNEPRRQSAVVVALASDSLSVSAGVGEGVSSDWRNAVEQALYSQGVQPHFQEDNADFRCDLKRRGKSVFSMLFSPGNTRHADSRSFEILEELKRRSSNNIPFFRASSADDWLMERNHVLFGTKVFPDSLLVAVFETELRFGIAVGHGFSPSRRKAVATKVRGHRVVEFDGQKRGTGLRVHAGKRHGVPRGQARHAGVGPSRRDPRTCWTSIESMWPAIFPPKDMSGSRSPSPKRAASPSWIRHRTS